MQKKPRMHVISEEDWRPDEVDTCRGIVSASGKRVAIANSVVVVMHRATNGW